MWITSTRQKADNDHKNPINNSKKQRKTEVVNILIFIIDFGSHFALDQVHLLKTSTYVK